MSIIFCSLSSCVSLLPPVLIIIFLSVQFFFSFLLWKMSLMPLCLLALAVRFHKNLMFYFGKFHFFYFRTLLLTLVLLLLLLLLWLSSHLIRLCSFLSSLQTKCIQTHIHIECIQRPSQHHQQFHANFLHFIYLWDVSHMPEQKLRMQIHSLATIFVFL